MKLASVITASDLNPRYLDCWPLARRAWREVAGLESTLVLLAARAEVPATLLDDPFVHVVEPIRGMHVGFQAQCIRLLYPALIDAPGAVLTTDVDMLPLSRSYFHRWPNRIDEGDFLAYRDVLVAGGEIPICYAAAAPRVWGELFEIASDADVAARLREWANGLEYDGVPGGRGWDTDQAMLYRALLQRGWLRRDVWILDDRFAGLRRLDGRILNKVPDRTVAKRIARGAYTDYHLLQPLAENRRVNEGVLELAVSAYGSRTA